MFAGKTSELIRRVAAAGPGLVIKPARDGRYHATRVVSHEGAGVDAVPVGAAAEILPVVAEAVRVAGVVGLVAIDEAHFFGDELIAPVRELLRRELRVLVVGLERDHRGDPFAPFPTLLCEADEVVKLNSRCARCGGPAIHSQRLVDSPERIVVGGADAYEPRCRGCFVPGARGSS